MTDSKITAPHESYTPDLYTEDTQSYVLIDQQAYAIDTDEETARARAAMVEAGVEVANVWHGHPECPDSYESRTAAIFVEVSQ